MRVGGGVGTLRPYITQGTCHFPFFLTEQAIPGSTLRTMGFFRENVCNKILHKNISKVTVQNSMIQSVTWGHMVTV